MKVNREFVTQDAVELIKLAVATDYVYQRPLHEIYTVCDKVVPEIKDVELEDPDDLINWIVDTIDEQEEQLVNMFGTVSNGEVKYTDLVEGLYNFILSFGL